jgi:hypothetical protein
VNLPLAAVSILKIIDQAHWRTSHSQRAARRTSIPSGDHCLCNHVPNEISLKTRARGGK